MQCRQGRGLGLGWAGLRCCWFSWARIATVRYLTFLGGSALVGTLELHDRLDYKVTDYRQDCLLRTDYLRYSLLVLCTLQYYRTSTYRPSSQHTCEPQADATSRSASRFGDTCPEIDPLLLTDWRPLAKTVDIFHCHRRITSSTKRSIMGRTSDKDVQAAFVEFRAKEDDKVGRMRSEI